MTTSRCNFSSAAAESLPRYGLSLVNVSKSFGGRRALHDLSIDIQPGCIHGLVGGNGAGKSTLAWLLAGRFPDYSGTVSCAGHPVELRTRADALKLGISLVPQEPALVASNSVAQNVGLCVPRNRRWMQFLRDRDLTTAVSVWNDRLGLDLDPHRPVSTLSLAAQQVVSLLCAVAQNPRFLLVDEPATGGDQTSLPALSRLFEYLRARGTAMLLISHRISDVLTIADTVSLMSDGAIADTRPSRSWRVTDINRQLLGGEGPPAFVAHRSASDSGPLTTNRTDPCLVLRREDGLTEIALPSGRVVGLRCTSTGSASWVLRSLIGIASMRHARATLKIDGVERCWSSAREALAERVAYLSCDREAEGGFPFMNVLDNLLIAFPPQHSRMWSLRSQRIADSAISSAIALGVDPERLYDRFSTLSGGNQQKVLVARLALSRARVALVDEPNRGVDAQTLPLLLDAIRAMTRLPAACVVASSDDAFLAALCDDIIDLTPAVPSDDP